MYWFFGAAFALLLVLALAGGVYFLIFNERAATWDQKAVNASGYPGQFVDERKTVKDQWIREVYAPNGGTITVHVTSQGPFVLMVLTGQTAKDYLSGKIQGPQQLLTASRADVLLTANSSELEFEGKTKLPVGSSSRIIIQNPNHDPIEVHLECFALPREK